MSNSAINQHNYNAKNSFYYVIRKKKIEPIFDDNINGVLVAAVWNLKKAGAQNFQPISIRVTANRERWYYQTGFRVSFEDHEQIRKATGLKNPSAKAKASIKQSFEMARTPKKTRMQYRCAARSFYRALGCQVVSVKDAFGEDTKKKTITGKMAKLKPAEATASAIAKWEQFMDSEGLSAATKSIYLRAFRVVMNSLLKEKLITKRPELTIKAGVRRKQDFITVPDIIKIRDYQGKYRTSADWWQCFISATEAT